MGIVVKMIDSKKVSAWCGYVAIDLKSVNAIESKILTRFFAVGYCIENDYWE